MNRRSAVSRILLLDGIVLIVIAAGYLALTNSTSQWLGERISPLERPDVEPSLLANHVAVGILLIPLALTTLYCAWGVKKGQQWSRIVSLMNGLSILSLPAVLSWFMGKKYYGSIVFLMAAFLMVIVGLTMLIPAVWFPKDNVERPQDVPVRQ